MLSVTESQLSQWLADFFWPFLRIAALIMAAPVFNIRQIPNRFKVLLAIMVTWILTPNLPASPVVYVFGAEALVMALQQVGIGVAIGFILQLAFGALIFGGQLMAYSMGLGFAYMMDPQNGAQVPVVSQYWLILGMLFFLLTDGHLVLLDALAASFEALPIAVDGLTRAGFWAIVAWGSRMFAAGVTMALPVLMALLLVNIGMGFVTRAAPQLNIFAVGFPITLAMGFVLMWVTLPQIMAGFSDLLDEALDQAGLMLALR